MIPDTSDDAPRVALVGAGPGDPGLLTLRAAELLGRADVVLYDVLTPERLLDFAPPAARKVCVRDLPGDHPDKYPHIHEFLIREGRAGRRVVRLKGGDPLVFGRGGEEAEQLRAAGVPYEIVPGVTAAFAAGAYLDIPLTHRAHASCLALVTGHELPNKPGNRIDWAALAAFPGTLAVYMGIARLPRLIEELIRHGKDPRTPCGIVERASTGAMRTVYAPLEELEAARRGAGLEAPGLILIGSVVGQRPEASWFEKRPLFGRRVLVTRPREQAAAMLRRLELLGAVPHHLPTLAIRDPADPAALDAALDAVKAGAWDWVVFASQNGAERFVARLLARGGDLRDLGRVQLAAVGPKTAEALARFHLRADCVPPAAVAESLAAELLPRVAGKRVLLARANRGRDVLPKELGTVAAEVGQVAAYEQHDGVDAAHPALAALRRGEIEFVTLSSSNAARALLAAFDETTLGRVGRGEVKLVAISPETAAAVRALGHPVAAVAAKHTGDGLIDAVVELAGG